MEINDTEWEKYTQHRNEREANYAEESYEAGPGFTDPTWKRPNQRHRHCYTRMTAHGFHHKVCLNGNFHEPSNHCTCRKCDGTANERLHVLRCAALTGLPLSQLVTNLDK